MVASARSVIATGDAWEDVMWSAMDATSPGQPPRHQIPVLKRLRKGLPPREGIPFPLETCQAPRPGPLMFSTPPQVSQASSSQLPSEHVLPHNSRGRSLGAVPSAMLARIRAKVSSRST